nr:encapsidation protein 22K [Tawny frogmouth aviadenovirus A]
MSRTSSGSGSRRSRLRTRGASRSALACLARSLSARGARVGTMFGGRGKERGEFAGVVADDRGGNVEAVNAFKDDGGLPSIKDRVPQRLMNSHPMSRPTAVVTSTLGSRWLARGLGRCRCRGGRGSGGGPPLGSLGRLLSAAGRRLLQRLVLRARSQVVGILASERLSVYVFVLGGKAGSRARGFPRFQTARLLLEHALGHRRFVAGSLQPVEF